MLKVKLAETQENGIRSTAAIAPPSLLFTIASEAQDAGRSENEGFIFLETIPLPTKMGNPMDLDS